MEALKEQIARMQEQYLLPASQISNLRAGISEVEAQDKYAEARDQYRGAKHEMENLENLKAVNIPEIQPKLTLGTGTIS